MVTQCDVASKTFLRHLRLRRVSASSPPSPIASLSHHPRHRPRHTHPFGCPVNLSHKIVTRLMLPQDEKCCWISSGVAP